MIRDAIVIGMGPAGAGTAAMLRDPAAFGIAGQALDVLALEARSAAPTRDRIVMLGSRATRALQQADQRIGRYLTDPTAPKGVASIAAIERTWRATAEIVGVDVRYDARVASVTDHGRAGVEVLLGDGSTHRARYLVDASGGRVGPFTHAAPTGETVYLTGNLPGSSSLKAVFTGGSVKVHGAGNDRAATSVFAFNDAREGATAFVLYPSRPARADDATFAHRLLRRHLESAGIDPSGLRDAGFIRTPHARTSSPVSGAMLAVGDSVRRVSPKTAAGVSNSLQDARDAARAIHDATSGTSPSEVALRRYASDASSR